jgi:two-component system sensor kinase FixL
MPPPSRTAALATGLSDDVQRLRAVVATAGCAIVVLQRDGHVLEYNPAAERIYGWTRDEVMSTTFERFLPADLLVPFQRRLDDILSGTDSLDFELAIHVKDKTLRIVSWNATRLCDETGQPYGVVAIGQDVTTARQAERARRKAEDLLRKTNEELERRVARRTAELTATVRELRTEITERKVIAGRLESVLRSSPDFIFQIDRRGRIAFLNRLLLGNADAVVGTTVYDWAPPAARPRIEAALQRVFGEGIPDRYEGIVVPVNGAGHDASYVFDIAPVIVDGHVESAVVNARDVTLSRVTEERLRTLEDDLTHAQRMSAMGTMAAAIAHELHQPLAAVANYSGACTELLRGKRGRSAELTSHLEQITGQTLRAGEIIRRLRSFLEKRAPERVPVTIARVIEETAPLLEVGTKQRGVTLEFALAADVPPVLGDRVQLQQIVVNLVQNAVEAVARAPNRQRLVRIEADCPGSRKVVELRIIDTGPGLTVEERERVFEPFYTTKTTGMGFGLSISRSIAEAHGGSLVAVPTVGGGATFRLALPALPEDASHEH